MNPQETTSILQVQNLNVFYGSFQAVKDVSFDVRAGEIFGLLGPNGAGKTSTLSAVEGLIKPRSGKITVCGYDMKSHPLEAKSNMGVQLQANSFQPELTITEIIQLFGGIYGVELSKDKVQGILIATIHNPRLVLLDEPTTGLDPQSRRQLWERIEAIKEMGHAVLLTTHSMEEAQSVCDRIGIIDHGKVITVDTPEALIDKHKDDPEVIQVSRKGRITLEDVFIALTGKEVRA
jgi:ABC-2 type transport system ATP-binding protein